MRKSYFWLGIFGLSAIASLATFVLSGPISPPSITKAQYVGRGASSILPIMDALKDRYPNLKYSSFGSDDGLRTGVNIGTYQTVYEDFGMTSSSRNPLEGERWNDVRTVTWATDAIGIMVNLPKDVKTINDAPPLVDIAELGKLYDLEKDTTTTWPQLISNIDLTSIVAPISSPIPLGRTRGKSSSGTAASFWEILDSHLPFGSTADEDHWLLTQNGGVWTGESNSQALSFLRSIDGSITYLSLGFALDKIEKGDSEVANITLDRTGNSTIWNAQKIDNARDGSYPWIRPFNIIYKTSKGHNAAQNLVFELLSPIVQEIIEKKNFIALTNDQLDKQFGSHDLDLIKQDLYKPDSIKVHDVYHDILGLKVTTEL